MKLNGDSPPPAIPATDIANEPVSDVDVVVDSVPLFQHTLPAPYMLTPSATSGRATPAVLDIRGPGIRSLSSG